MDIQDYVQSLGLPEDQQAAVEGLLYAYREGRLKPAAIQQDAAMRLTNAICCRGTGLADFDTRLEAVLVAFRRGIHQGVMR